MTTAATVTPAKTPGFDPKVPVLIDTEGGTRSVAGFERRGELRIKTAETFKDVERLVWEIEAAKVKPAGIILDSITGLISKTSFDVGHDGIPKNGIWENRFNLATSQPHWGVMSTTIVLLNRVARSLGIPFFMTAQEKERLDEASGKEMHFPAANPKVLEDIVPFSDGILRVSVNTTMFEAGGVRFEPGSRAIRCQPNDEIYAKCRVPDDAPPAPAIIGNEKATANWGPAIERLAKATLEPLATIVIYGRAGTGKTRLATELMLHYAKQNTKKG
ncbi:MAG: hypothetical protein KGL39_12750 [Patescibacteria group bacterium]|nr:hypothetical protein [Patescibacteria group bacterium]